MPFLRALPLLLTLPGAAVAAPPAPTVATPVSASTTAAATATTPAAATPFDAAMRRTFIAAWDAARLRRDDSWRAYAAALPASYPLAPYIDHAVLTRALTVNDAAAVDAFLAREDGSWLADDLRTRWLTLLAERQRWPEFLAAWRPRDTPALRCAYVDASVHAGRSAEVRAEARAIWLTGATLPDECNAMIGWLARDGALDDAIVWQRIALAAQARDAKLVRALAPRLPAAQRPEVERWAATITAPQAEIPRLTGNAERTRERAVLAITILARRNHALAAQSWPALSQRVAFTDDERARAIGAIALWKAANAAPDAAAWMRQVPWDKAEDAVREWRVREALSRAALAEAAQAIRTLSPAQQLDPRWRYLRARLLEIDGQVDAARASFATLADEANFHGFLAAERSGRDAYSLCGLEPSRDPALRAKVERLPGLVRALEWHALDRTPQARREWDHTLAALSPAERVLAVEVAQRHGWLDRGPLTLLRPDELRYYSLRFPLGMRADVERAARHHKIAPALVFGLIRSESAWVVDARSSADARGLMQLLPSTAARLAKRERQPYAGASDLFKPKLNIALGTAHLAEVLARYDDRAWLAAAAYNAGPVPVDRWLGQRGQLPVDLWLETIPYKETREYVARVLAFATIYDWRLTGQVASIGDRLGLQGPTRIATPTRRAVACAIPQPEAASRQAGK